MSGERVSAQLGTCDLCGLLVLSRRRVFSIEDDCEVDACGDCRDAVRDDNDRAGSEAVERLGIDVTHEVAMIRARIAWRTARVATFGRNLAVAGALCAALEMGDRNAREAYWHARSIWRPNLDGEAWPNNWTEFPR